MGGMSRLLTDDEVTRQLADLPPEARAKLLERSVLLVTTANRRSDIHRGDYLEDVAIKRFDDAGRVVGQRRFLGLYAERVGRDSVFEIPLIRDKVLAIIGPFSSSECRVVFPAAERAGVAVMSMASSAPGLAEPFTYAFRNTTDEGYMFTQVVRALKQKSYPTATAAIVRRLPRS